MRIWLLSREIGLENNTQRAIRERAAERGIDLRPIFPELCVPHLDGDDFSITCEGELLTLPDAVLNYRADSGCHVSFTLSRHLEAAGVPVVNATSATLLARDKAASLQALAAAGLPVPRTSLLPLEADADRLMARVPELPIVVKLPVSSCGRGVYLCRSRSELEEVLAELRRTASAGQSILLQEFIPGSPARDHRVTVVGGQAVGSSVREAVAGQWKTNLALGNRSIDCPLDSEMERLAIAACQVLGLELGGVDLLIGPDGYLLSEVNPAPLFRTDQPGSPWKFDIPAAIFDFFDGLRSPKGSARGAAR